MAQAGGGIRPGNAHQSIPSSIQDFTLLTEFGTSPVFYFPSCPHFLPCHRLSLLLLLFSVPLPHTSLFPLSALSHTLPCSFQPHLAISRHLCQSRLSSSHGLSQIQGPGHPGLQTLFEALKVYTAGSATVRAAHHLLPRCLLLVPRACEHQNKGLIFNPNSFQSLNNIDGSHL